MNKTILYLGLKDKDTKKEVRTRKAIKTVCNLLINIYKLDGATIQTGKGVYKHNKGDGKIVKENTLIITLLDIEDAIINKIIEDLKNIFNQESILKENSMIKYNFL